MPSLDRTAPWFSWHEWHDVYRALKVPKSHKDVTQRIHAWLSRGHCRVSVELTGLLLATFLKDPVMGGDEAIAVDAEALRSLYSITIMRFINGLTDQEQTGRYIQPVAVKCRELGIPTELVDVRHSIAHMVVPTLPQLRHAAGLCLEYLEKRYWRKQASLLDVQHNDINLWMFLVDGLRLFVCKVDRCRLPSKVADELRRSSLPSDNPTLAIERRLRELLRAHAARKAGHQASVWDTLKEDEAPAVSRWSEKLSRELPNIIETVERLLPVCPSERLFLSCLGCLLLPAFEPADHPLMMVGVSQIVAQLSPNFAVRLMSQVVRTILRCCESSDWEELDESLQQELDVTATDSGAADCRTFRNAHNDRHLASLRRFEGQWEPSVFELWMGVLELPFTEREHMRRSLDKEQVALRLVRWLRHLLLLPSVDEKKDEALLPPVLELLFDCSTHKKVESQLAAFLDTTRCRILAALRAIAPKVAETIARVLVSRMPVPSDTCANSKDITDGRSQEEGPRALLRLLLDARCITSPSQEEKLITLHAAAGALLSSDAAGCPLHIDDFVRLLLQSATPRVRPPSTANSFMKPLSCVPSSLGPGSSRLLEDPTIMDIADALETREEKVFVSMSPASSVPWTVPGTQWNAAMQVVEEHLPVLGFPHPTTEEVLTKYVEAMPHTEWGTHKRSRPDDGSEVAKAKKTKCRQHEEREEEEEEDGNFCRQTFDKRRMEFALPSIPCLY